MTLEEYGAVADHHRKMRNDFFAGRLSEDEYFEHRKTWVANQADFDRSRGESPK